MNLTCAQEDLAHGLATVSRAVASRTMLPILSNILIEASDGRVQLSATNLEIGIRAWFEGDVETPGAITVPARLLSDFVHSLPTPQVTLSLDDKTRTLNIRSDRYRADIKGIDAADFPILPAVTDGTVFLLDPVMLKEMIAQVSIAAATDDARPILTGVLTTVDPDAGRLTLSAADGFRLSIREAEFTEPLDGQVSVVIPARALQELARAIGDQTDPVQVALTPGRNQVLFRLRQVDIVSQLLDGVFPDVAKIIPTGHGTRAVVNTKAFLGAVRIASFFARDSANIVRIGFAPGSDSQPGQISVSAQSAEVGGNQSEIEASVEGQPVEIAFNAKYLMDILGVLRSDQVVYDVTTPSSPGVIRPVDDTDFTHVIMPMHIAR